jgi:hypothetical protein
MVSLKARAVRRVLLGSKLYFLHMSEEPKFLKEYSKKEHAEERDEMAAQIREARAERVESPLLSKSAELAVANYKEADAEVEELNQTGVNEIHDLTAFVGVRQRLSGTGEDQIQIPAQFDKPKQILENFYAHEQAKWAESKGSQEEMVRLFKEEHLASLDMEEYGLLMKHFPSAMVTHVTRQGIRDHTGMFEHTKGEGQYVDGFMQILKSGELKSPLGVAASEHGKEEAVAKAIRLDRAESKQEAEERLEESLSGAFDGYADRAAVHVATEAVADHYYGSERGNEIFIAFPSAYIAAEHSFIGNLAQGRDLKNNDTWILQDEALDKGMNINAGVAFIPAEARVDPLTGSRYALDDLKRPIENQQQREEIDSLLSSEEFIAFAQEDVDSNRKTSETIQLLKQSFGVMDPGMLEALAGKTNEVRFLKMYKDNLQEFARRSKTITDSVLESSGKRFIEAENTVSSQEFWETYFTQNPDQRPSKVEYYRGNDPTKALIEWKMRHSLMDVGDEASYDIGGKVSVESHESQDKDRFKSIAEKIIDERFPIHASIPVETESYPPPPPPPF